MIEKVRLKDFQSWGDQVFDLAPFTVIVGDSDVGKSAIIRALQAFQSPFRGTDFVKHGKGQASVEIWFDDHTLKYVKGKFVNRYVLDGEIYEKCGSNVPEDVQALFDLTPAKFKSESVSLNVSGQFDSPFLLFSSGTSVSQIMGAVLNLTLVFTAQYLVGQDVRKLGSRLAFITENLDAECKKLLNDFPEQSISFVHAKLDTLRTLREKRNMCDRDMSGISQLQHQHTDFAHQYEGVEEVEIPDFVDLDSVGEQVSGLLSAPLLVQEARSQKEGAQLPVLQDVPQFDFDSVSDGLSSMQSAGVLLSEARRQKQDYVDASGSEQRNAEAMQELDRSLSEFLDFIEVCPLSGLVLSADCKEALSTMGVDDA